METKRVTVDVTEHDVLTGERGSLCLCPIARAMQRLVKDGVKPTVSYSEIEFIVGVEMVDEYAVPPPEAQAFVLAFDAGGASRAGPISFEIDMPVSVLR